MKKITLLLLVAGLFSFNSVFSQATKQLNFGLIGISYDIPVTTDIAIAPFAGSNFDLSYLTLGVKGNYFFDNLMGLPDTWDVYGGANAGYALGVGNDISNDFALGLQVGGRWFWNEKWGLYLELGGGNLGGTGGLGITMKL
ncbi:MAG: hypothetical protein GXO89_03385 [Chlorobi bacterium]|nr:hypothetical protein [Chlorobiota bacterium]